MESFGRFLRAEREARGVSIEDLAAVTKISRQVLIDLEADHFESLPPPVFLKGFVRTIARTLALPQQEVVERFDEFMATHGPGAGLPGDDESTGGSSGESGPTPAPRESWGAMPFVLGVVALLVAIVIAYQVGSEDEPGKVTQYANQPEPTQPAKADTPAEAEASEPAPDAAAEPAAKAQSEPEPEPDPEPDAAVPAADNPAETAATPEPAEVQAAARDQWIVLQARKEIWVRASEDDEDPRNFKLEAGESIRQRFAETLEIRVGDPSRLSVITPEGEFKTLGAASKPRTWKFPLSEQARAELAELSADFVEPAPDPEPEADPEPESEPNIEEPATEEEPPSGETVPAPGEPAPNDDAAE